MNNVEIIKEIIAIKKRGERKEIVEAIKKYSEEEYENKENIWELAQKSDDELKSVLLGILHYYKYDYQKTVYYEIQQAGYNIVTCGNCGEIIMHALDESVEVFCPNCDRNISLSDCPDIYY